MDDTHPNTPPAAEPADEGDDRPILAGVAKPAETPQAADEPTPVRTMVMVGERPFRRRLIGRLTRRTHGAVEIVLSEGERSEVLELVRLRPDGTVANVTSLHEEDFTTMDEAMRALKEQRRARHAATPKRRVEYRPSHNAEPPMGRGVPRGKVAP